MCIILNKIWAGSWHTLTLYYDCSNLNMSFININLWLSCLPAGVPWQGPDGSQAGLGSFDLHLLLSSLNRQQHKQLQWAKADIWTMLTSYGFSNQHPCVFIYAFANKTLNMCVVWDWDPYCNLRVRVSDWETGCIQIISDCPDIFFLYGNYAGYEAWLMKL